MTTFDLRSLRLVPGVEQSVHNDVVLEGFELGGQRYAPELPAIPTKLTVSRTISGTLLALSFSCAIVGPCMRCLAPASIRVRVQAHEYDPTDPDPAGDEPTAYVADDVVDLTQWMHDEVALALPDQILCRPDCAGICPECGKDLNVEPHVHEVENSDPRWDALAALRDTLE